MFHRLRDRHLQHVKDALALVSHSQRLAVEAPTTAFLAFHVNVGEEMQLHFLHAVALAGFAAPAFHVEAEAARLISAHTAFGQLGIELADGVPHAGVSRRIAARGAADGLLADADDVVYVLGDARYLVVASCALEALVNDVVCGAVQRFVHQRALAAAGHACHRDELADGEAGVDAFQVVGARACNLNRLAVAVTPRFRRCNAQLAA